MKLQLHAFCGTFVENVKNLKNVVSVYKTLKNFLLQNRQKNSWILHTYSPLECVIKFSLSVSTSYIIGHIIVKVT